MKRGFTLAEVLVTLGIIGVVSAMTIPTLMRNHQKTVYVTQLRKVYSMLSQAVDNALQDENAVGLGETKYSNKTNQTASAEFLKKYLKVVQDCGQVPVPCFAEKYKSLDGYNINIEEIEHKINSVVTTADGTAISIFGDWMYYDPDDPSWPHYYHVHVDINGKDGPNILGRDLFYLEIYQDGKIAETYYNGLDDQSWKCDGDVYSYGSGCLSKIIEDGWKMDY